MKLNKEQHRAAYHMDGPMLVLAGPGSGKTHLLVERIRIMIEENHIPPDNILVITFSKKAARQMQKRFEKRVKDSSYPVTFGTFHAVFYHILQQYDPNISRLITEEEISSFVRRAITDSMPDSDFFRSEENTNTVAGLISAYKNFGEEFFEINEYALSFEPYEKEEFKKICELYSEYVRRAGLIDFDDMIVRCRELLRKHESILRKWQKKYRYFLVDEFQDINDAQYDILRLLAGDGRNVFAVGDDDQSIYAFRGSRPQLMKKFKHQYVGCRQVTLTMNYRCCENVIGVADAVIRHNIDRFDRPTQRHLPSKNGGTVMIVNAESTDVQAAFVCDTIEDMIRNGVYGEDEIAVLYRSDHCGLRFIKMAKKRDINVNVMTAHASKGLEFKCVFMISLQEGLFPHKKDMDGNSEEERRLMYVAITRAIECLYMCTVSTEHGKRPSRFVLEAMKNNKYITDCLRLKRV